MDRYVRYRLCCLWLLLVASARAADWPMWRCDPGRTGETTETLSDTLHLQWVRTLPTAQPAFQNPRLQFDRGYEPIVLGQRLFVGSSGNDCLLALDTATGRELWRFYAAGPIRVAPVAWRERVYCGSDDGHLYCLSAADGALVWKFQVVPSDRRLLGNGRMISVWPVRGGPVLHAGRVYFAAGVWPFEGVFIYALAAETGRVIWRNDRAGYLYGIQPHGATALGGVTPQGYLLIDGDDLIVPCGTAHPARFDLATGKLKSFQLPEAGRLPGGWFAALSRERRRGEESAPPLRLTYDRTINTDRHEDDTRTGQGQPDVRSRIRVGDRDYRFQDGFPGVDGPIHTMLAGDGKLFVVALDGRLHCFGPNAAVATKHAEDVAGPPPADEQVVGRVRRILDATSQRCGQALVIGAKRGERGPKGREGEAPASGQCAMAEELIRQTALHVLVLEPDAAVAADLRQRWDRAGWYGRRVAVLAVDPLTAGLPPYFANLIVCEQASGTSATLEELVRLLHSLRPHGGTAWFALPAEAGDRIRRAAEAVGPGVEVLSSDGAVQLVRRGGLPGASNYTQPWQPSRDGQVRAPLGVLWYDDAVGLFKRSPQPMFVDGVMRVYDKLWLGYPSGDRPPYKLDPTPLYMDVYTGRILSAAEIGTAASRFPAFDPRQKQPDQYRPPTQRDAWKPDPPAPGQRANPLTGQPEPRTFPKSYGCDGGFDYGFVYTMRSGTAAFYDQRAESGTVHISGPRSGCTNSIVPACGLLNLPYYYKGCTCSYPLPTSAALVRMPAAYEQWSTWGQAGPEPVREIQRVGINFGAPGDRMTEAGTLWLEAPSVGGPSPVLDLTWEPEKPDFFYQHSLFVRGGRGWPWVVASGVEGISRVTLRGLKPGRYVVRLYFTEPADLSEGARVFDVAVQGQPVLQQFDIIRAGGRMRAVVHQVDDVSSSGNLEIQTIQRTGRTLLSGIEVVAQGLRLDDLPDLDPTTPTGSRP